LFVILPIALVELSNESYKHFVAKEILFWILRNMKHDVSSEWKVPNGYVDLCDKTTRTLYEIEFHVSKSYRNRKIELYRMPGYEIIIVDCSNLPADVDEIREYLSQFIVPD
jgi:hypothetical protein